jgi:hypothetical protein
MKHFVTPANARVPLLPDSIPAKKKKKRDSRFPGNDGRVL